MSHGKLKILITSVGSLVGQNLLDVLEFPGFKRRDLVTVIGTNSVDASPNNFRCDTCYLVAPTGDGTFSEQLKKILIEERPDLILSGRDEDTLTVALLLEQANLPGRMPYGKPRTLALALDKLQTCHFARRHGLPFAETWGNGDAAELGTLEEFLSRHPLPLIAKPVQGFASKGVVFVRRRADIAAVAARGDYVLQEYLGRGKDLEPYFQQLSGPTPLFAHAPGIYHHSCHLFVGPDGLHSPVFVSRNDHQSGVTMGFRKVQDPELEGLARRYGEALYQEGGWGPLTIQFRKDRYGNWKAQEVNLRTNGNTFPRFLMGQDDLGMIIAALFPERNFPLYEPSDKTRQFIVGKSLRSEILYQDGLDALQRTGLWQQAG